MNFTGLNDNDERTLTTCDNTIMYLGGYNKIGAGILFNMFQNYTNLYQHSIIKIKFTFMKIDDWVADDYLKIFIDEQLSFDQRFDTL